MNYSQNQIKNLKYNDFMFFISNEMCMYDDIMKQEIARNDLVEANIMREKWNLLEKVRKEFNKIYE